jgi:preprotein translocase subunit YajC
MNSQIIFLLLFFAVFYFFFILPQTKKAKAQSKFREELKKGDKVVTTGGIHGSILELKDLTVVIDTGGGNTLKVDKSAISQEASALAYADKNKTDK